LIKFEKVVKHAGRITMLASTKPEKINLWLYWEGTFSRGDKY